MNESIFFIMFVFLLWLGFYSIPKEINKLSEERKRIDELNKRFQTYSQAELDYEYEQAKERLNEDYAKGYIEGLQDGARKRGNIKL